MLMIADVIYKSCHDAMRAIMESYRECLRIVSRVEANGHHGLDRAPLHSVINQLVDNYCTFVRMILDASTEMQAGVSMALDEGAISIEAAEELAGRIRLLKEEYLALIDESFVSAVKSINNGK